MSEIDEMQDELDMADAANVALEMANAALQRDVARLTAENQALREAARWVPCSERYPDTDAIFRWSTENVMLLCGDEVISPAYYNLDDSALFKRGQWVHRSEVIGGDVTHWRELLAPPEGEA